MSTKVIAIIPARAGSKRIPGKNSKPLLGKPLLEWTIDYAKSLQGLEHIALSVDSDELAALGVKNGIEVNRLRPADLATDTASSIDVVLEELQYQSEQGRVFDQVLLLQPTSPFRSAMLWPAAQKMKASTLAPAVIGVSPSPVYPEHLFRMSQTHELQPVLPASQLHKRTQDLPSSFVVNGSLYLVDIQAMRQTRSFIPAGTVGVVSDSPHLDIDLDTPEDWLQAEYLADYYGVKP